MTVTLSVNKLNYGRLQKKLCELHAKLCDRFIKPVSRTCVANYARKFVNYVRICEARYVAKLHMPTYIGTHVGFARSH